jgi:hypothetical protein
MPALLGDADVPDTPNLFRVLLTERHWNKYVTFRNQYDKAAARIDRSLVGTAPSRGQFYRWMSGDLRGLPYADHCRVLETLFPEWTTTKLFKPCPPHLLPGALDSQEATTPQANAPSLSATDAGRFADVTAVFTSRSDFTSAMPPHVLFDGAREIRAAGLSLNLLCHQYPDHQLRALIEGGTSVHCLFLDPEGEAIKAREREEGYAGNELSSLTAINIAVLTQRIRARLTPEARDRLRVAVYDETIRFNLTFVDDLCVAQPYLPDARGVDSPTFVLDRRTTPAGLFPVFDQVFTALAERSRPL